MAKLRNKREKVSLLEKIDNFAVLFPEGVLGNVAYELIIIKIQS